jgi:hypothetical protein
VNTWVPRLQRQSRWVMQRTFWGKDFPNYEARLAQLVKQEVPPASYKMRTSDKASAHHHCWGQLRRQHRKPPLVQL